MSVTTEYLHFVKQASRSDASGIGRRASWERVGLGAAALGSFLLLAATSESIWPVFLGPLVLIGVAWLMGLRSLWPSSLAELTGRKPALLQVEGGEREQRTEMASLESRIAAGEPRRVIDELQSGKSRTGKNYPKDLYVVGRQYMRLGQYEDAREWLLKAARQSSKRSDLQDAVNSHLSVCNVQLLAEGDACFAAGDFHGARERYARLTQCLSDREGRQLAIFLRSSCVYCKLGHYEDADQAVLQALKSDEETDAALGLLDLLQRLINPKDHDSQATDLTSQIESELASYVAGLMDGLRVHP